MHKISPKLRLDNEINAGSMADIAFLLLIFFLVTTTINDEKGILVKLPEMSDVLIPVNQNNVLKIYVNKHNNILLNGQQILENAILDQVIEFITNPHSNDMFPSSPKKAIVALKTDRGTNYATYVAVYDQLVKAYRDIREAASKSQYNQSFVTLSLDHKKQIRKQFPILISETEMGN